MPRVLDVIEPFLRTAWETDAQREPDRQLTTLLFTDIVDSTGHMAKLGDAAWRELLERHHAIVRTQLARDRGREVDTAGDGFFASFDGRRVPSAVRRRLPTASASSASRFARDSIQANASSSTGRSRESQSIPGRASLLMRAAGEVLVSSTVKDLVAGSGLEFEDRGVHELKGIPGEWRLYAAV